MKQHKGMRPQDIVILLELLVNPDSSPKKIDLAQRLKISQSEVSESLNRSMIAGLVSDRCNVYQSAFFDFLKHGFRFVFPVQPGGMVRGIATAHSHPFMKQSFSSELNFVWPDFKANDMGLSIEPLYPKQVDAVKDNPNLYQALALLDVLRVGRTREIAVALPALKQLFSHAPTQ